MALLETGGLHIYRSNQLEVLAELLGSLLERDAEQGIDPLTPVSVGVGSRGMERWLRHRLATRLGICAHVHFPFPGAVIDHLLRAVVPKETEQGIWTENQLIWSILEAIPTLIASDDPAVAPLANYLRNTTDDIIEGRELALAEQIAQVFDRYDLYRSDLVRLWSGEEVADPPRLPARLQWQGVLWAHLTSTLGGANTVSARIAAMRRQLQQGEPCLTGHPPIRLFGISTLPPCWLELLSDVARHVPVELFVPCTSVLAWDGVRDHQGQSVDFRRMDRVTQVPSALNHALSSSVDHPLIQSMGRAALDMAIVLDSLPTRAQFDIGIDSTISQPELPSVLSLLQADILRGQARQAPVAIDTQDHSIRLHSCPGPARQVDVLRDVILDLLDRRPDLEPRDVLVMTPDIDTYAPLLTAAFGPGASVQDLRITISDRRVRGTNPVLDTLIRVLELAAVRVTASATLDLLALGPVAQRFGLSAEDVATIRTWVGESGFRWGLSGTDRADAGQPNDDQNTLVFAADRLALGVVMADEGQAIQLGDTPALTPFDAAEGAAVGPIGRFLEFVAILSEEIQRLRTPCDLGTWVDRLAGSPNSIGTLSRMTASDGAFAQATRRARTVFLDLQSAAGSVKRPIGLEAIRHLLASRSALPNPSSRAHSGAVTACSFMPMRAVPYRVICLLGMDEGNFPRTGARPGFDWTSLAPRVGDPIPADEDRLIFLETIMSARAHLAILYTGRNERTNEACAPCVPVSELLDVLDDQFSGADGQTARQQLITEHPLQAYDARCFRAGELLPDAPWSFDGDLCAAANRVHQDRHAPIFIPDPAALSPYEVPDEISTDELARFLAHPGKTLMRNRFGVGQAWDDTPIANHLPTAMESFELGRIGRDFLSRTIQSSAEASGIPDPDPWIAHLQGRGVLPAGQTARSLLDGPLQVIQGIARDCAGILSSTPSTTDIRIPFRIGGQNITLAGRIDGIWDQTLLRFFWGGGGTSGKRWWLPLPWVELLAWAATHECDAPQLWTAHGDLSGGEPSIQYRSYTPPADPHATLKWMLQMYISGMHSPLALFPRSSCTFAWNLRPGQRGANAMQSPVFAQHFEDGTGPHAEQVKIEDAHARALSDWGTPDGSGDASDPFLRRLYGDEVPLTDTNGSVDSAFAANALRLWGPIFAGRQTSKQPPSNGRSS